MEIMKTKESIFVWPLKGEPVFEIFDDGEIRTYEKLSVVDYEDIMKAMSKVIVSYDGLKKQIWNT